MFGKNSLLEADELQRIDSSLRVREKQNLPGLGF